MNNQNHRNRLNKCYSKDSEKERRIEEREGNGRAAFVSSGLSTVNLILILILSRPGSRVYWVDFDLNPLERRDNTRTRGWNSAAGILLINFIASSSRNEALYACRASLCVISNIIQI